VRAPASARAALGLQAAALRACLLRRGVLDTPWTLTATVPAGRTDFTRLQLVLAGLPAPRE
jgi:hypothetical protein